MWTYLENYFNIKKSFVFYGSYHNEWRNQMVHVVFVPLIYTTTLSFLTKVKITPSLNLSQVGATLYALTFIIMEPVAGTLYAPLVYGMYYAATNFFAHCPLLAAAVNVVGWASQIIAHKFCEQRQPAFLEDPLQAIHSAVFFVWLEVLFHLGYNPAKKKELDALVAARIAKLNADGAAAQRNH
ncbi:hypothetical protein STCU_01289 [Strigomonas culicis]|uniref:DUF962-domain-containing protein n=1 Tax=Strigomonas culicis TaxID=28005 RepID=S9UVT2_9TRYP|nr:hypothetical protein STCU_03554 [Strigomonas culicis]EPY31884.1 hypothetical protein STCU_03140 [Strigomonas culicis]EPY35022.1 hypothetical protein STCU_01289 [Strigomonas culicis]|eukprot:EPY31238.1 hypothetical protein STCU_03554 [Strigomonas culicis]